MLVLFWLVWYITGPVCETFDYWDPPQQEMHDVLFYGGGGITLVAAGFAIAISLCQRLRERFARAVRLRTLAFQPLVLFYSNLITLLESRAASVHSPPVPLRI